MIGADDDCARAGLDPLGAFVCAAPERADCAAAAGPLAGVRLAVKDVIDVAGLPTSLGVPSWAGPVAARDAAAVAAATAAGARVVGKTATAELALSLDTPATRNPFDRERIAGGSSGGSAAAVAAGLAELALATDTSGSVRCPAALCGVVGLKPTLGRVSRHGMAPLAPSQDVVGVIAPDANGCARLLAVLPDDGVGDRERAWWAGWGARPGGVSDGAHRRGELAGVRVGIARAALARGASRGVARAVADAAALLARAGATVEEVPLEGLRAAAAASAVIVFAEAADAWGGGTGDGRGAGAPPFSVAVRAGLRAGAELPAATYGQALAVRERLRASQRALFAARGLDALLLPTLPVCAPPRGVRAVAVAGRQRPLEAALARFVALASVTGQPAVSVPCGLGTEGLPVGAQLVGRPGDELGLLRIATAIEAGAGGQAVARARRRIASDISCVI